MAYCDFTEPYLIKAQGPGHEEAAEIEALLTAFGVDFERLHRWWHPDAWLCDCGEHGVGGAHVCNYYAED